MGRLEKLKKKGKVYFALTKKVRITKIIDEFSKIGESHPNNISKGYVKEGLEIEPPTVGMPYWLSSFHTSTVTKITKGTFKTLNSTYKYEVLENDESEN